MKKKKLLAFLFIFVLFVGFEALVISGFCVKEMRYLSEREILDRYFWGDAAAKMSEQEKIDSLIKLGGEYPNCCRIETQPIAHTWLDVFGNALIFCRSFYGVVTNLPNERNSGEAYRETYTEIDACGGKKNLDEYSETGSFQSYKQKIQINEKFWKEVKNGER